MGKLTKDVFNESCCDGGICSINDKSAQSCGCDPGADWVCAHHQQVALDAGYSLEEIFPPITFVTQTVLPSIWNDGPKAAPSGGDYISGNISTIGAHGDKKEIQMGREDYALHNDYSTPSIGQAQEFVVKDSGKRQEFSSGMKRDVTESKVDYTLVLDGPLIERLAEHLTKGARKYDKRNWLKAAGSAEYERFRESAFRHFLQWYRGDVDEDHFAAVVFNLNGAEYVKDKIKGGK